MLNILIILSREEMTLLQTQAADFEKTSSRVTLLHKCRNRYALLACNLCVLHQFLDLENFNSNMVNAEWVPGPTQITNMEKIWKITNKMCEL